MLQVCAKLKRALERGQGHHKDYDTTTVATEKNPEDDARDDQQKVPADEAPPSVGGAVKQPVFPAYENGRLAEEKREAAIPVAQRLFWQGQSSVGKWIDVGVYCQSSEKRLDYEDQNWYTPGEFIEYYGHSQFRDDCG